ncbi:MAG TPA: thioredoxin domain-containing protein [Elusimicrobiota bacterium]|nr:thioredoxin domain-containing protein [Elusimicrobiota bacterium]
MKNFIRRAPASLAALSLAAAIVSAAAPCRAQWSAALSAAEPRLAAQSKAAAAAHDAAQVKKFRALMAAVYAGKAVAAQDVDWAAAWMDECVQTGRADSLKRALEEPFMYESVAQWPAAAMARKEYDAYTTLTMTLNSPFPEDLKTDFVLAANFRAFKEALQDYAPPGAQPPVADITAQNYRALVQNSKLPVFLDYFATWCGPCRMAAPVVRRLALKYKGRVFFGRVDTDAQAPLAGKADIRAMPTFILIKNGKEVYRAVGIPDANPADIARGLDAAVQKYLLAP